MKSYGVNPSLSILKYVSETATSLTTLSTTKRRKRLKLQQSILISRTLARLHPLIAKSYKLELFLLLFVYFYAINMAAMTVFVYVRYSKHTIPATYVN